MVRIVTVIATHDGFAEWCKSQTASEIGPIRLTKKQGFFSGMRDLIPDLQKPREWNTQWCSGQDTEEFGLWDRLIGEAAKYGINPYMLGEALDDWRSQGLVGDDTTWDDLIECEVAYVSS